MDRRSFLKTLGGLSASIVIPTEAIAAVLPPEWRISGIRWQRAYDIEMNAWRFCASCFIGKLVDETPSVISLENPIQLFVDLISDKEELDSISKEAAVRVLTNGAQHKLEQMKNGLSEISSS